MTKQEFADKLTDLFEVEEQMTPETDLRDVEEYDSMAALSVIAFIDREFGKTLTADQIASVTTVGSLISLIGEELFQ